MASCYSHGLCKLAQDTWRSLCKKWGLQDHYPTLANWEFCDGTLMFEDDVFSNTTKLTRAGFHGQVRVFKGASLHGSGGACACCVWFVMTVQVCLLVICQPCS